MRSGVLVLFIFDYFQIRSFGNSLTITSKNARQSNSHQSMLPELPQPYDRGHLHHKISGKEVITSFQLQGEVLASNGNDSRRHKLRNRFQVLIQKLNLDEQQNQLFYDFCLSFLSCLTGVLTTLTVVLSRRAIAFIDKNYRLSNPILLPLLGSTVVACMYRMDSHIGYSPFSSEYLKVHFDAKSAQHIGGPLDHDSPYFTYNNNDLPPPLHAMDPIHETFPPWYLFSSLRQMLRLLAVVIGIGSGCSLGY